MSILVNPEQDNKVLIDALKYTSDIVVSLTEKISIQDQKISQLEKIIIDLKNDIKSEFQKNDKKVNNIYDKLNNLEKNTLDYNNYGSNNMIDNNLNNLNNFNDSNVDFEILSQTVKDLTSGLNLDIETINNTICNTTAVSDITSFNNDDINNFKKNKASNLVQNLIKQKLELEKKINGLVDNPNVSNNQTINMKNNSNILIENDKTQNSSQQNSSQQNSSQQNSGQQNPDINAIRKKKNFARRF
jgi:uncharacterized coiled-coil protein SlyX